MITKSLSDLQFTKFELYRLSKIMMFLIPVVMCSHDVTGNEIRNDIMNDDIFRGHVYTMIGELDCSYLDLMRKVRDNYLNVLYD